jgi:solute carrier family 25 citrate transporter 1
MANKNKNRSEASISRFTIGGFCGLIEISITYPLEFVKNSMQVQPGRFQNPIHCFKTNVTAHGLSVLYRGIPSWWLFAFPRSAVRFTCFDLLSHQIEIDNDIRRDAIAGVGAGVVEAYCALIPCQNLSIKMTHDANLPNHLKKYKKNFFSDAVLIMRHCGFRGMFKGAIPTVIKNSLNMSIRFPGFHYLKTKRLEAKMKKNISVINNNGKSCLPTLSAMELMTCGGIAGAISSIITHPIDVVKANMMGLNASKYGNPANAAIVLFRDSGWKGFFVGLTPRISRVAVEVGLLFTIFEKISEMLEVEGRI